MTTIVHLELHLDPSGLDAARKVIDDTLQATRAWPGNEGIEVIVDDADPAHVIVVEQWATTQDHSDYAEWRLTPEGANDLGTVVAARPVKTIYSERLPLSFA